MPITLVHSALTGKPQSRYSGQMQQIAIYDMDKTITRRATFMPFVVHVVRHHRRWRALALPLMLLTSLGFGLGLINRGQLKQANLKLLLGRRIDQAQLQAIAAGFARATLARNLLEPARAQIIAERGEGRRIVLATASYSFYVIEIAKLLGIDDVIATRATAAAGKVSPVIDGENCYGEAKLRMVKTWFESAGIARDDAHVRFYSDHVSDAPCLAWADEAFAVNAHAPLRLLAGERGWETRNWLSQS